FNLNGRVIVLNSTFAGNTAEDGRSVYTLAHPSIQPDGGIFVVGADVGIENSILGDTTGGSEVVNNQLPDALPATVHVGTHDVSTTAVSNTGGTVLGEVTVVTPAELNLGSLGPNGGPTDTIPLGGGSVAINAGAFDPGPDGIPGTADDGTPLTDQRGLARVSGGRVDIGAFEVQNQAPTVTNFTRVGAEDNTLAFTAADFTSHYHDADGDALVKVRIVTLPTTGGVLKLNGEAVAAGQEIAAADLYLLTFVPDLNFSGTVTFQFNAMDGTLFAATPATITLDIRSAQQQTEALDQRVQALVDSGVLNGGQGEALFITLRDNKGDAGKVQAFLNQVQDFLSASILTQEQADALTEPGRILLVSVSRR